MKPTVLTPPIKNKLVYEADLPSDEDEDLLFSDDST
jgi:hypothetical protein